MSTTPNKYSPCGIGPKRPKGNTCHLPSRCSVGIKGSGEVNCPTNWQPWLECISSFASCRTLFAVLCLSQATKLLNCCSFAAFNFVAIIVRWPSCAKDSTLSLKLWGITMRVLHRTLLPLVQSYPLTKKYWTVSLLFQSPTRMHCLTSKSPLSWCEFSSTYLVVMAFAVDVWATNPTYSSSTFALANTTLILPGLYGWYTPWWGIYQALPSTGFNWSGGTLRA